MTDHDPELDHILDRVEAAGLIETYTDVGSGHEPIRRRAREVTSATARSTDGPGQDRGDSVGQRPFLTTHSC
jgi:hypothetical protein